MLASDSFDRPNVNLSGDNTDSYAGGITEAWSIIQGSVSIVDKHAQSADGAAVVDVAESDVEVLAHLRKLVDTNTEVGIIVRATNFNNMWVAYLDGVADEVQLWRRQAGTWTEEAATAFAQSVDVDYAMKVVADGATIRVFVNDVLSITQPTAPFNQTAVLHGLFFGSTGSNGANADNFRVRDLTPEFESSSSSTLSSSST